MRNLLVVLLALLMTGCASSSPSPIKKETAIINSSLKETHQLAIDALIEIFQDRKPERKFTEIARLDVHLEKSHFIGSDLESAMPHLKKQARAAGADAIIKFRERFSSIAETRIYHVTAIGIVFDK